MEKQGKRFLFNCYSSLFNYLYVNHNFLKAFIKSVFFKKNICNQNQTMPNL